MDEISGRVILIATCAFGLEAVVKRELTDMGFDDFEVENGLVSFSAKISDIPMLNINLRVADRVHIKLGEFEAKDFDALFDGVNSLPFEKYIPEKGNFIVNAKSVKSGLVSVRTIQSVSESAIIKKLRTKYIGIDRFEKSFSKYDIEVSILKDIATVTLDTSGVGLHKRGYRTKQGDAPIKETLAAALVLLSNWKPDKTLYDPFCGSGTILLEALMIGRNMAPGLLRNFISEDWDFIGKAHWDKARKEAKQRIDHNIELDIRGSDINHIVLNIAKDNLSNLGFDDDIDFQKQDFRKLSLNVKNGVVISNPPYGERMGDEAAIKKLYKDFGVFLKKLDKWSYFVITSNEDFEDYIGLKSDKKRKLYNGRIKTDYYMYF